jgi:23S rRNA pseudouridine1911/1915/1917 synthase
MAPPLSSEHLLEVSEEDRGVRLDVYLAYRVPQLSRRGAQALIESGDALVNGRPARKSEVLRPGDTVELAWLGPGAWKKPAPDPDAPVNLVFVDDELVAIDKPSGMPSVPLSPDEMFTVAGAVAARFPECATIGRRPGDGGLLQRLDRGTSGLMLAARRLEAFDFLCQEQEQGRISKAYYAVIPDQELPSRIDYRLAPAGPGGIRMRPTAKGGVPASTHIELLARRGGLALIQATIRHGARHQIRAHLASCGAPIVGDISYQGKEHSRMLLHCREVSLKHPRTGEQMRLLCDPPNGFWPSC